MKCDYLARAWRGWGTQTINMYSTGVEIKCQEEGREYGAGRFVSRMDGALVDMYSENEQNPSSQYVS